MLVLMLVASLSVRAQYAPPAGKDVYIPWALNANDFKNELSQWSYARMACTEDVAVLWDRRFGAEPAKALDMDGESMRVYIPRLLRNMQRIYDSLREKKKRIMSGAFASKHRVMVLFNYSLKDTIYGAEQGALWLSPISVRGENYDRVAEELERLMILQSKSKGD